MTRKEGSPPALRRRRRRARGGAGVAGHHRLDRQGRLPRRRRRRPAGEHGRPAPQDPRGSADGQAQRAAAGGLTPRAMHGARRLDFQRPAPAARPRQAGTSLASPGAPRTIVRGGCSGAVGRSNDVRQWSGADRGHVEHDLDLFANQHAAARQPVLPGQPEVVAIDHALDGHVGPRVSDLMQPVVMPHSPTTNAAPPWALL